MKTVLFIDGPTLYESYQHSCRMYGEFIACGDIVVYPWRQERKDYSPDEVNDVLAQSVGEDDSWRAIIVSDLSRENLPDYACDLWRALSREVDVSMLEANLTTIAPYLSGRGLEDLRQVGLDPATGHFVREGFEPEPQPSQQVNPFDFAQNLGLVSYPAAVQHPVVKLAQQLAGLPAHIRDDSCVGLSISQIDALLTEGAQKGQLVPKLTSRVDVAEQGVAPDGEVMLDMARRAFPETTLGGYRSSDLFLKCPRPDDVLIVSYRDLVDNAGDAAAIGLPGSMGSVRSEFCIRNHYPDSTRFIVVDRHRNGSDRRIKGEMAFWSSLLVLSLNAERSFGMRSYALYRLDIGVDYDQYVDELKSKHSYAVSARELLEQRLRIIEGALEPDEEGNAPLPPYAGYVAVDFKVPDEVELEIPVKKYGWLKDSYKPHRRELANLAYGFGSTFRRLKRMPPLDEERYGQDRARFDRAMEETLEEPRYALQAAARDFHSVEPLPQDVLTGYRANTRQVETLERELRERELELASSYSLSLFDSDVFGRLMGMVDRRVKKRMQPRARLREVSYVALSVIVAALVSFGPYMFGYLGGVGVNGASIGVSLACVALLLVVGAFVLKLSHWQVKAMLRDVNEYMHFLVGQLRSKADELGGRISGYATYRRGYSLLVRQRDETPPYTAESVALRRYFIDLDRIIEQYDEDFGAADIEPEPSPENSFLTWVQAETAVSAPGFFNIEPEPFYIERPFNESICLGEKVRVPFRFIRWLELREVCVYEPGYEKGVVR